MSPGKRLYLAGKIDANDYRHELVRGLRDSYGTAQIDEHWPILSDAIFAFFDYTGPYFISCDHGCFHGESSHGQLGGKNGNCDNVTPSRTTVVSRCLTGINRADVVFAWLDSKDCYGTLAELGYAWARGKTVIIGTGQDFDCEGDLWFVHHGPHTTVVQAKNPRNALTDGLIQLRLLPFGSRQEAEFWRQWWQGPAAIARDVDLIPQCRVLDKYRVDFAHLSSRTAIELDGFPDHSRREKFRGDRERDRDLMSNGWKVIRFASDELSHDTGGCVLQAWRLIGQAQSRKYA